jgi:hypothetical protein
MKKSKARKLEYCITEFDNVYETRAFDTLLTRTLGHNAFKMTRTKKPKGYAFMFWATPEEQEILEELWDQVLAMKWSEEEFEELISK